MILLLTKASLIVIVLLAFYKLFLEKESFYVANRIYLLSCLLLACTLPFVVLPEMVRHQGIVVDLISPEESVDSKIVADKNTLTQHLPTTEDTQQPPSTTPASVIPPDQDQQEFQQGSIVIDESASTTETEAETSAVPGFSFWLLALYGFGVLLFTINLLLQLGMTFWKVYQNEDKIEDEDYVIVNMSGKVDPCSFFKYIFIHPDSYDYDTYEQILAHEKIHVRQRHSIDLLLAEIAIIVLWFNPFVWLLRKEVEKNIEYQTDDLLISQDTDEKERYQLNLVKIATYTQPLQITTNYNQSLIMQRIMRMNTKKSNPYSYWKYSFMAPLVLLLLLFLNKPADGFAGVTELSDALPITEPTPMKIEQQLLANNEEEAQKEVPTKTAESAAPTTPTQPKAVVVNEESDCKALITAIRMQQIEKVKTLLKSVDPNCINPNPGYEKLEHSTGSYVLVDRHAHTPLVAAAKTGNTEIAQLLLDAGARIELDAQGQGSALIAAAQRGQAKFIEFLLYKGAKVDYESPNYGTALIAAANNGHKEVALLLLAKGAQIDYDSPNQGTALIAAAGNGHEMVVELLLAKGAKLDLDAPNRGTALIAAANNGHKGTVEMLIAIGSKVNRSSPNQGTALIAAANNGHTSTAKLLIAKGAEINQISPNQGTALIAAANNGHTSTAEMLIAEGAKIDQIAPNQGTALIAAANNGHTSTIQMLLAKGASADQSTPYQGNALIAAANNGHKGAIEYLISQGAKVDHTDPYQGTALIAASNNGHTATIEYLISQGAKVNHSTPNQGTALIAAANNGHLDAIEFLLSKGADINLNSPNQGTALIAAANNGHLQTVRYLVEQGANVKGEVNGRTALLAAQQNRHQEVAKFLESKAAR